MSLIPQKKTGFSTAKLLRLRRAGWLHPVLIKGRWLYDDGELAAVPQLIDKASEILLGRDTNRRVGRPAYCELAAALATGGV